MKPENLLSLSGRRLSELVGADGIGRDFQRANFPRESDRVEVASWLKD
jgi:hypothetical protein